MQCRHWNCRRRRSQPSSTICWPTERVWGPGQRDEDGPIDDTEQHLLQRACDGDAAAFGDLVTRHSTSAHRVATVVLGTTEGAADAVQDASVKAWRARKRIDPKRGFRAWYLRIVANTARNDRRSRSRRADLALKASTVRLVSDMTPEVAAVTVDEREIVVRALNRLADDERLVVALRFFEDLTQAEMAEVIGCPTGTVKSRLSRALVKLRQALADDSGDPGGLT